MRVCLHGLLSVFDYVSLHMFRVRVVCRAGVALPRAWLHRRTLQAALGWDLFSRALVARMLHAEAEAGEAAEVVAEVPSWRRWWGSLSLAEAAASKSSARSMPALPSLPEL